jgi:hypothetical protein
LALNGERIAAGKAMGLYASGRLGLVVGSLRSHPRRQRAGDAHEPGRFVGGRGYRVGVAVSGWSLKP